MSAVVSSRLRGAPRAEPGWSGRRRCPSPLDRDLDGRLQDELRAAIPFDEQRDELPDAGALEAAMRAVHGLGDDVIGNVGERLGQAIHHLIDLALLLSVFHARHHRTNYALCA